MGASNSSEWELDFGDEDWGASNVVPISSAPSTRRGLPRVKSPSGRIPKTDEKPLVRAPPVRIPTTGSRPRPPMEHRRVFPIADPQTEATLEVDAARLPSHPSRPPSRVHPDLDLQFARHDDPYQRSALIELGRLQEASSRQTWIAFAAGLVGAGALIAWFFL